MTLLESVAGNLGKLLCLLGPYLVSYLFDGESGENVCGLDFMQRTLGHVSFLVPFPNTA